MDKKELLIKQLTKTQKQESKLLKKKEALFMKEKVKPALNQLKEKIPDKLKTGLEKAFYKGFQLVFQKGYHVIEKTYDKEKIEIEHELNNYAIDKHASKRHLRKIDRFSGQTKLVNQSIAAVEGGVLGLFGIGLPDIPLFISVLVKTINEIALSYGYSYDSDEEKIYMLYLICGAFTKEEVQTKYSNQVDVLGRAIDSSQPTSLDLDSVMKETSDLLSSTLLVSKVIQGIPLLGIIGGSFNPIMVNQLGNYAGIKYKKRFLQKKILEK